MLNWFFSETRPTTDLKMWSIKKLLKTCQPENRTASPIHNDTL